ncbi:LysR family transcriptional regulator [Photobacterium sp. WH77]|uniref:LysR family transcriptional regulator n=1 Tax=unclassified Photobacterium TaxID=2628852 RepID=UPI001EDB6F18|nr:MULTISPECIES: LysR family transcriptional regulator [unclassified Photobacterium]MCG2838105.1 LysR family transcriptional regulator [Photobacterium sp. WH77]MCG2845723.1 LysR family transcriptional regulator [Photobacterium sp. WH80]
MDLNAMVMFAQVVECGSFTQAAEAMDMTKSTISRKIADLEKDLAVRLLTRSTRNLVLTHEGEAFYQSCRQVVEIANQAELEVTANQDLIRGRLNVVMPVEVGQKVFGKSINAFLKQYPHVSLHLELSNREVDLIAEGVDLYVQVGDINDSGMVARPFHSSRRILVASPDYLALNGSIESPVDLVAPHHQIKIYNAVKIPHWALEKDGHQVQIELPYRFRVNTITSAMSACLDGLGIALLPEFICREHIDRGELIQILPGWVSPVVPISFVYPQRDLIPNRLRLFIDYLLERFEVITSVADSQE